MNRGLLLKTAREAWPVTLICAVGLMLFEILFALASSMFDPQFTEQWLQMPFVQNMFQALLGTSTGGPVGVGAFDAMAWVHPVLLTIFWSHAITACTRVPAGEVDRGTIDILFGLPVSRWNLYLSETLVWVVSTGLVLAMGVVGVMLGNLFKTNSTLNLGSLAAIVANLLCLTFAVGGLAFLVSAFSDRRGRAIALAFGVVVASFFLNFLAQFWDPAKHVAFLSILNYYQPFAIIRLGSWPVGDMAILMAFAAGFWLAGGLVFARRNICTV